jgi:NADPH-dependent 2,4-dienoyl-CoA reductase/sulfur reductase-like enzyme
VGGGFIGAEVAASARMTGSSATIVMPEPVVMQRAFGSEVGAWFERGLREHGVDVRPSTMVEEYRLEGERIAATLSSGEQLVVDGVLIGIGVVPVVGLAAQCLLDLAMGGVAVDSQLRTSDPAISAIGDIAAYESVLHGERTRIEHWDVARSQGAHVARRLAGEDPGDYDVVPYFFSGMGDWAYAEYLGIGAGDTIMRSAPEAPTLSAAYVDDQDVLRGVIVVGTPDDLEAARTLVPRGVRVDRALVASGAPLDTCVVDVESLA